MTNILPLAEALEREFRTDDIKLLGLLEELADNDDIQGLLEAIAYDYANSKIGGYPHTTARSWIDNAIDDKVREEVAAADAKMRASEGDSL